MKFTYTISIFTIFVVILVSSFNFGYSKISENNPMILEGSGFAVTEKVIQNSEIDFALYSEQKKGNKIDFKIENGFVTLGNDDFAVFDITGSFLRDGRYLRISGTAENEANKVKVSFFGRLIEDSNQGSVYSFTGRITHDDTSYKILYVSKLSESEIITKTKTDVDKGIVIHIAQGSYRQDFGTSYINRPDIETQTSVQGETSLRARYFSQDRLTTDPGTTITFVNNDIVPHSIVSGSGLGQNTRIGTDDFKICENMEELPKGFSYSQSDCAFTLDGRIISGEILPGKSTTITFDEVGTYKLIDPDYPWMNMIIQLFPDVENETIRQGSPQLGN